ncbi:MAG TPA: hypothetical protein VEQ65_03930, partial [Opitutus sp.]|nr:hypothetical protein [Opitutus sp.]
IRDGVWSTLPTASPWPDVAQVAEVFGYEGLNPSSWNLVLDPSGRAGVLSVTARGSTDLFAVEEDRAVSFLTHASRQGIGALGSTVRLGTTHYVAGHEDPRTIRVFALEGAEVRMVGQYADVAVGRALAPSLVRSTRGDALALWARGAGWFVYPLDPRTGAADQPIAISPPELARLPRACAPDEDGYLLEGPVGIDPYAEFVDGAERVAARGFEGRFLVTERGLCVSELVAQSVGPVEAGLRPKPGGGATATRTSVSLVLSDRTEGGRRWGFRCGN